MPLTKVQKAAKMQQAKDILINATKSLGFSMLPPNETFDVSIKNIKCFKKLQK